MNSATNKANKIATELVARMDNILGYDATEVSEDACWARYSFELQGHTGRTLRAWTAGYVAETVRQASRVAKGYELRNLKRKAAEANRSLDKRARD